MRAIRDGVLCAAAVVALSVGQAAVGATPGGLLAGLERSARAADPAFTGFSAERGAVFGSEGKAKSPTRFDLSNLHIQNYGDTAIASYTLLVSTASPDGVKVAAHNESRVMIKLNGTWKVVHVHKSPAWQAPHISS